MLLWEQDSASFSVYCLITEIIIYFWASISPSGEEVLFYWFSVWRSKKNLARYIAVLLFTDRNLHLYTIIILESAYLVTYLQALVQQQQYISTLQCCCHVSICCRTWRRRSMSTGQYCNGARPSHSKMSRHRPADATSSGAFGKNRNNNDRSTGAYCSIGLRPCLDLKPFSIWTLWYFHLYLVIIVQL